MQSEPNFFNIQDLQAVTTQIGEISEPDLDIDHIFDHHPPDAIAQQKHAAIRQAAKEFARVILEHTPPSADQLIAIERVREAVFRANAAIALDGRIHRLVDE